MTENTDLIARLRMYAAGDVASDTVTDALCIEAADALEAKPVDCGMCESFVGCVNSPTKAKEICLDGDHYQGLPIVQLYRTSP